MAFRLTSVEEFAERLGKSLKDTKTLLSKLDIPMVGGYFDLGAYEAAQAEPKATNIKSAPKSAWTIAETDGVGAIKHVLDKVDLDIVRHLSRGSNYVTVRNSKGQRRHVKVYATHSARGDGYSAKWMVRGFLNPDVPQPSHYLFVSWRGPLAWCLSHKQLLAMHAKAVEKPDSIEVAFVPRSFLSWPTGAVRIWMDSSEEAYLLTSKRQLAL